MPSMTLWNCLYVRGALLLFRSIILQKSPNKDFWTFTDFLYLLIKVVKGMRVLVCHSNAHFFAHCHNILIPHSAKGFGILFKCEVCRSPLLEEVG